jgi:hypothetical protein
MAATTQILKKLQLLQELVEREETGDEVMEVTVSKLLNYELEKLRGRQSQIREKLTTFEEKYGLKTDEFYQRFQEGKLGDEMDFFEWSALADIYQEISQWLAEAERVSNASPNPDTAQ